MPSFSIEGEAFCLESYLKVTIDGESWVQGRMLRSTIESMSGIELEFDRVIQIRDLKGHYTTTCILVRFFDEIRELMFHPLLSKKELCTLTPVASLGPHSGGMGSDARDCEAKKLLSGYRNPAASIRSRHSDLWGTSRSRVARQETRQEKRPNAGIKPEVTSAAKCRKDDDARLQQHFDEIAELHHRTASLPPLPLSCNMPLLPSPPLSPQPLPPVVWPTVLPPLPPALPTHFPSPQDLDGKLVMPSGIPGVDIIRNGIPRDICKATIKDALQAEKDQKTFPIENGRRTPGSRTPGTQDRHGEPTTPTTSSDFPNLTYDFLSQVGTCQLTTLPLLL